MAGRLPGEALEVVVRVSEGDPFMAAAMVRGLVESGALEPVARWRRGPSWLARTPTKATYKTPPSVMRSCFTPRDCGCCGWARQGGPWRS